MIPVAPPAALAAKLRAGTRAQHRAVEQAPFVKRLLDGRVGAALYASYVVSLYFIYAAMEAALDHHRGHPALSLLDFPDLRRVPSLERDLAYFRGPAWRDSTHPSEATRAYTARILALTSQSPLLLTGHFYVRYLGDLLGGQLVARSVERALALRGGAGVAFHRFGSAHERARLRERYRAQLDALPIDADAAERIVEEGRNAFLYNAHLFEELDRR